MHSWDVTEAMEELHGSGSENPVGKYSGSFTIKKCRILHSLLKSCRDVGKSLGKSCEEDAFRLVQSASVNSVIKEKKT